MICGRGSYQSVWTLKITECWTELGLLCQIQDPIWENLGPDTWFQNGYVDVSKDFDFLDLSGPLEPKEVPHPPPTPVKN